MTGFGDVGGRDHSLARIFRMGVVQRAVLDSMRDGKPHTVANIAEGSGKSPAQVRGALRGLLAVDFVEQVGTGVWQLNSDGRRAMELLR